MPLITGLITNSCLNNKSYYDSVYFNIPIFSFAYFISKKSGAVFENSNPEAGII
jgi:hypothetical protein